MGDVGRPGEPGEPGRDVSTNNQIRSQCIACMPVLTCGNK